MVNARIKRGILTLTVLLLFTALISFIFTFENENGEKTDHGSVRLLSEDEVAATDIVKDGASDYVIIFSTDDGMQSDNDFAKELESTLRKKYGVRVRYRADSSTKETEHEILLGITDRAFSEELNEAIKAVETNGELIWVVAEKDGKLAYLANSPEAFERGIDDFLAYARDDGFSVPSGIQKIFTLSRAEYDAELKEEQDRIEAEKELERLKRIEELKVLITEFEYADFGDAPSTSMAGSSYGKPAVYPNSGEHPRINVTAYMIPKILEYMKTEEAKYTVAEFWKMANEEYDGILPAATEHTTGRIGVHNMDEQGLGKIEAKAFAYLLTGDELYAYEAIYAMKNFLTTVDIQHIHSDQCREFGRIMYCTAEVYDWCYGLLTEDDKAQFIMACADIGSSRNQNTDFGNQMEVGFPPRLQGCVSGHGSEHQVLRDYLSIAIAIFDEDPTWYEWVGGLVYNYFVPFRDYYFTSGTYPQGMNVYAPHRFDADLWSAWLLLSATGEIPYSSDFARVTRSFFANETPNGSFFGTGDGGRLSSGTNFWHHAVISSALYGDEPLRSQAFKFTSGFSGYSGYTVSFSFAHMLILSTSYHEKKEIEEPVDRFSETDPVVYLGSPLGQMTVRSAWNDENAAATFMKLGERTTANHEHADAGTFQIFYKGLYTGDTGSYDKYGSTHWTYYHTQTVAHNGLLISNPAFTGDDPSVPSAYFYSGGQRKLSEANNLETWLTSNYDTGTVLGAEWAYNSDGSTDYAYLGGDITAAYEAHTVSYVGRQMLTLYTGNPDAPMYFIVYDKITSAGEDFKKTFLLHTKNEPETDEENGTVISTQSGGRLVLKSLLGGESITAVGGEGMTYAINGRQCATLNGRDGSEWGRVEISPTSEALTHHLLNFMYVTDADSELMLEPELLVADTENARGALIDKNVLLFAEGDGENNSSEIELTTEGRGLHRFIVMGMFTGTWNVSVDGVSVAHAVSSESGGMITFYAPAGDVLISPGKDIAPSNGGRIVYNTFGGIVPDDAPLVYEIGVPVTLPDNIVNGSDRFVGWYTSPYYEEETRVTELIGTDKGKINVYAKFKGVAFEEDYESIVIEDTTHASENGIHYNGKEGTVFRTVTDEKTNNTYLQVVKGLTDQQIDAGKSPSSFLYGEKVFTLTIDLARTDADVLSSTCRIRGQKGSSDTIPYFSVSTGGSVSLGGKIGVMTLTKSFQTLAVTFDFNEKTLTGYDKEGGVLAQMSITAPAASGLDAENTDGWFTSLSSILNWWMGGGETILIDNFSIYAGEYVPKPIVLPDGYSKINYNLNGGAFVSEPERIYKEGVATLLEPGVVKGVDEFLGWYTTPNFEKGTAIAEISPDTTGEVTVYAKWAGKVIGSDFEGTDFEISDKNERVDGIDLAATGKAGCVFRSEKDPFGNTYVYWYKGSADPQFKYSGNLGSTSVATFMISLATVEGETPMAIQYRVRSSSKALTAENPSNFISLFTTDTKGNVKLGGKTTVATLNSDSFTTVIASIDFEAKAIIAYSEDGEELARVEFEIDDYKDWLSAMDLPMYIYPTGGQSLKIDNVIINAAPYSPKEEILPSTMGKINYVTNGGTLPAGAPKYYTKGVDAFTLPIPMKKNAEFLGWFKDAALTERITEITLGDTENFILYASWRTTVLDYNADDVTLDYEGKDDGSMGSANAGGLTFQTKGENSFYKTLDDGAGGKYLLWSKGSGDPQIIKSGTLSEAAGGDKVISFSLTFAKDADTPFVAFQARMRTAIIDGKRKELQLFKLTTDGTLYLSNVTGSETRVGQFGAEFKTLGVVADFNTGMLYGYNEEGVQVCQCAMTLPAPYTTPAEMYDAVTSDILGFYAGTTAQTALRIKRITITTGNSFEL
ncbi:MAG: InlB B-repeat-containing protein [Clostridia bacterium]|nr:InlB B-repeat-containing protein [Clostridia bacterium]